LTDDALIEAALAEDVGDGDVTTAATVDAGTRGRATTTQKAPGVISGLGVAEAVFHRLDPAAAIERLGPEGEWREAGAGVLRVEGSARALLTAERTALNFLGRLSGIATLTATVVRAIRDAGGQAQLLDTRKTTPGLRALEKHAVGCGGGRNHRFGLDDAVLVKDNHLRAAGSVATAVELVRGATDLPVEVECESLDQVREALDAGVDALLLDNMTLAELREAVALNAGRTRLEASGGVSLDTIRDIAETGVDEISVGALTHSAPSLDVSLELT
jgi:nicotinate-nucleotide pyrophosphorylase (carboxylating)